MASVTTDNGANTRPAGGALTPNQVRAVAYQAGFRGSALDTAVRIAGAESARIPTNRYAPGPQEDSRGLWQINIAPTANPKYASANLYNPLVNARIAFAMSQGGKNWSPWTTYTSGKYLGQPAGNGLAPIGGGGQTGTGGISPAPGGRVAAAQQQQPQGLSKAVIAGQYLANEPSVNPWQLPIPGQAPQTTDASAQSNPLLTSGLLPTSQAQVSQPAVSKAQNALQGLAGKAPLNQHPAAFAAGLKGSGYVNPIPHATIGQTDMGVDINLPVGAPIRAIGDSQVIGISPNWYGSQPYLLLRLLNGPDAGKYYYVSEQINIGVKPGQKVRAGQTIGTYASSGTGIEIGWGSSVPGRTLTQATAPQQVATRHAGHGTDAGNSFRNFLHSLGA